MGERGQESYSNPDSVRYLVAADLHFTWRDEGWKEETVEKLEEYGREYDCEGLIVPGDIGSMEDIERVLESDFDFVKIASGDHDAEYERFHDLEEARQFDTDLEWEEVRGAGYSLGMRHKPGSLGIGATGKHSGTSTLENYDIAIYGHSHMPWDRLVDGETLAIGAGSLFENYNRRGVIPERSFHILELSDEINIKHLDFDTGRLVETSTYRKNGEGLEEVYSNWSWVGPREDRFVID